MSKPHFIQRLEDAAAELQATLRSWKHAPEVGKTIGPLTSQFESVILAIKESSDVVVPRETAAAVWKLMEAFDAAARLTKNADVVQDVSVITTGVRQFYFARGAKSGSNGDVSF